MQRGLAQRVLEIGAARHGRRPHAVCLGQRGKVGLRQQGLAVHVVVEQLLPLPDHAQALVVYDQHFDREL